MSNQTYYWFSREDDTLGCGYERVWTHAPADCINSTFTMYQQYVPAWNRRVPAEAPGLGEVGIAYTTHWSDRRGVYSLTHGYTGMGGSEWTPAQLRAIAADMERREG